VPVTPEKPVRTGEEAHAHGLTPEYAEKLVAEIRADRDARDQYLLGLFRPDDHEARDASEA
jgi:hypothetical protein